MFEDIRNSINRQVPPVTKNLIIINLLVWLVEILVPGFSGKIVGLFGLHLVSGDSFNPIQLVTYMFVHDPHSFMHILFNMFTLWMFGRMLERVWGSWRYFMFYMICGIGAAVVQEVVWELTWLHEYVAGVAQMNGLSYEAMKQVVDSAIAYGDPQWAQGINAFKGSMVTIGASGAVFGLLLGFAFVFPDLPLYLMFIPVPIKAKYMVIGYAVLEFFLGVSGTMSMVAHFAHLGGMLFGLIVLLIWKKQGKLGGGFFY